MEMKMNPIYARNTYASQLIEGQDKSKSLFNNKNYSHYDQNCIASAMKLKRFLVCRP